jgi:uncharacterized membrane protein YeaQ/YmgE (transglycosylase-associated protein family)
MAAIGGAQTLSRGGAAEEDRMQLADVTVNFTISDLTLWMLAGAVGGLATGQLMKSKGWLILGDLFFGVVGGLVGIFVIGTLLKFSQYGQLAQVLLALAGGVLTQVFARFVMVVRRRAKGAS